MAGVCVAIVERLVPFSVLCSIGEHLNALRLSRVQSRHVEFSRVARLTSIDVRSILDPVAFETEWRATHDHIRVEVLAQRNIPHSPNPGDLRAIYQFIRACKPRHVLEIGTCFGVSTLYIATALRQNAAETHSQCGELTTIDIRDMNNRNTEPLASSGLVHSPREAVISAGVGDIVQFVVACSFEFLRTTSHRFDLVYFDGSTAAADVYRDLQNVNNALRNDAVLLQHVFLPQGRSLWDSERAITGPWRAVQRLQAEGAPLEAAPLGELPWPTKRGGRTTSLALLGRSSFEEAGDRPLPSR